jgi:endonuclease-3 related protein
LLKQFGPQRWWPAKSPWEMMVGAILTQNTAWSNVEKAIDSLKKAGALNLSKIARMPRRRLERLIRSSGFFRQKAERLQSFARVLQKDPQFFRSLCSRAKGRAVGEVRKRLLELDGIGPETADSILLYASGYPVFVVDAYTRRIGQRLGIFRYNDYQDIQNYFQSDLPAEASLYNEFHALLVMLGKNICKRAAPRCSECPLQSDCVFGRKR